MAAACCHRAEDKHLRFVSLGKSLISILVLALSNSNETSFFVCPQFPMAISVKLCWLLNVFEMFD